MRKKQLCLVAAIALLCFGLAPRAFGDSVSMQLTDAGNDILGGVYVGPYTVTVNGVSEQVVCDDFSDETYIGETWNASISTYPIGPGNTVVKFAQTQTDQTQLYNEAAWLAQNLYATAGTTTAGEIQFAIWQLFEPTATAGQMTPFQTLQYYDGAADVAAATSWLDSANSQTFTPDEFSNFLVYTPTSMPPQEFIYSASASEPPLPLIIVADFLLFGLALEFLRRRGVLTLNSM